MDEDNQNPNPDETQDDQVQGQDTRTVPYNRFSAVTRERRAAEKAAQDAIRERDQLQTKLNDLEQAQKATARESLVQKVARELNVPENLAKRLQGDDEAAIRADAETLMAGLAPKTAPNLDARTGDGNGGDKAPQTFTQSQIRDPKFYQANRTAILAAMAAGKIVKD